MLDGLHTPTARRPTIEPENLSSRLTRGRRRLLDYERMEAGVVPLECEDITAVQCEGLDLQYVTDSVNPRPMQVDTGSPSSVSVYRYSTVGTQ